MSVDTLQIDGQEKLNIVSVGVFSGENQGKCSKENPEVIRGDDFVFAAAIDMGEHRMNQEDRIAISSIERDGKVVGVKVYVIDGMGGHGDGEKAAQYFGEEVVKDKPFAQVITDSQIVYVDQNVDPDGGCGFFGGVLEGNVLKNINQMGDCRCLIVDKYGRIKFRNRVDKMTQDMVDLGRITQEERCNHMLNHIVTKSLKRNNTQETTTYKDQILEEGDSVIIVSDGFDMFTDDQLVWILQKQSAEAGVKKVHEENLKGYRGDETILQTAGIAEKLTQHPSDNSSIAVMVYGKGCDTVASEYGDTLEESQARKEAKAKNITFVSKREAAVWRNGLYEVVQNVFIPASGYRFVDPSPGRLNYAVVEDRPACDYQVSKLQENGLDDGMHLVSRQWQRKLEDGTEEDYTVWYFMDIKDGQCNDVYLNFYGSDGMKYEVVSGRYDELSKGNFMGNCSDPYGKIVVENGAFENFKFIKGKGKLVRDDGTVEEGEFENDILLSGTRQNSDGSRIEKGDFLEGVLCGVKCSLKENNRLIEGVFSNGKPQGKCRCLFKNGWSIECEFQNGEPVYGQKGIIRGPEYDGNGQKLSSLKRIKYNEVIKEGVTFKMIESYNDEMSIQNIQTTFRRRVGAIGVGLLAIAAVAGYTLTKSDDLVVYTPAAESINVQSINPGDLQSQFIAFTSQPNLDNKVINDMGIWLRNATALQKTLVQDDPIKNMLDLYIPVMQEKLIQIIQNIYGFTNIVINENSQVTLNNKVYQGVDLSCSDGHFFVPNEAENLLIYINHSNLAFPIHLDKKPKDISTVDYIKAAINGLD